jgi:acetylornithine deacetylase
VAALEGGLAFNVVPTSAALTWSVRPWPGFDRAAWDRELAAMIASVERTTGATIALEFVTDHAPFGVDDAALAALVAGHARALVGLDFWTEAALYQAAGMSAIVIGPGDIAQAHAADEFVTLADLDWAVELFTHVYQASRRDG